MTKLKRLFLFLSISPLFYPMALHGISNQEFERTNSLLSASKAENSNTETASVSWTLHDWISGTAELGIGWRYDGVQYKGKVIGATLPQSFRLSDTANLVQINFRGDVTACKYLYARTDFGYGILVTDRTHFHQEISGITLATSYSKNKNAGFAWDWLVAGGFHVPVYKEMITLEPEAGYLFKKLRIDNSTTTRISSPFAGLRFFVDFCDHYCWEAFFDYLFGATREQSAEYINTVTGLPVFLPMIKGGGVRNSYQVGSSLKYKPWEHWVFTLDWQLFYAQGKDKDYPYGPLNTLSENLNSWMSNQVEVMVRYNF